MDFLTTKQTAEMWGVTPKRVTVLAGQGRIPGAKRMDGRWFIPANAAKPTDPRKQHASSADSEQYLFPFPLCIVTAPEQVRGFTTEQKELYRLDLLFEQGDFAEARELAENLVHSKNRYVCIGALYLLPSVCMSLYDFEAMDRYSAMFYDMCSSEKKHKADVDALRIELDGELTSFSEFIEEIDRLDMRDCSQEILPFISVYKLLALVSRYRLGGARPDASVYEALCRMYEKQGCFYNVLFIHFYLSLYYSFSQEKDLEFEHLRAAFDISVRYDVLFTLSLIAYLSQGALEQVLSDLPLAYAERFTKLCENNMKSRNARAVYLGKRAMLENLDANDIKLLSYCLSNSSIDQMAHDFGLTRSGINKRLNRLYGKLGVSSKKELSAKFLDSVLNWK